MTGGNVMTSYVHVGNMKVAEVLYNFVNQEALPETGLDIEQFWQDFEKLIADFTPRNKELLEKRQQLQEKINTWHKENPAFNQGAYTAFLEDIGYLEPVVDDFKIDLKNIDDEIAHIAGPQLVVPINNPRYAINAANSRWGSLYDAFYGTDVISVEDGADKTGSYNPIRGEKVIAKGREFLDASTPLATGSHIDATEYKIEHGKLIVTLRNDQKVGLKDEVKFIGFNGEASNLSSVLLKNNGLHIDIQIDRNDPIGKTDDAGIKDIVIESAITSIMDCEDSVAAVDANDKVDVYRNWMGLIRGELSTTFEKDGKTITRTFNGDR